MQDGDGPLIGVDIDSANTETLKTIMMLCVEMEMQQKAPQRHHLHGYAALHEYATTHWNSHMRDADVSKASVEDEQTLGPLLVKFCRDPSVIEEWSGSCGYEIWDNVNVSVLRKWLDDNELLSLLPSIDQDWIKSTAKQPGSIFVEVGKLDARMWLQDNDWRPLACCWSVFNCPQTVAGLALGSMDQGFDGPHIIEETAEWAGFIKNALWHRRVAQAYREGSYLDEAQKHYEIALRLNPDMWRTRTGLAIVAGNRRDYERAIDLYNEEIEVIQAHSEEESAEKNFQLALNMKYRGRTYSTLGEAEKAYQSFREACVADLDNFDTFAESLSFLESENQYHELISWTKEVFQGTNMVGAKPYLVKYTSTRDDGYKDIFFSASRRAARQTGDLSYLVENLRDAIEFGRHNQHDITTIMLEMGLADIYHYERISSDRAVRIWDRILHMSTGSLNHEMAIADVMCTRMIAEYYLAMARDTKGLECRQYVSRLENMAKSKGRLRQSYNLSGATMVLGLWYRLNEQPKEANACLRGHIRQALQILSDDDLDNDVEAWQDLSKVLLLAGDEQNTVATFQKMY